MKISEPLSENDKILFLNHDQVCHAHDTFFNGCIIEFGANNVYEFPCYPKTHSDFQAHGHSYAWWCFNDLNHVTSYDLATWAQSINKGQVKYIIGNNRSMENFVNLLKMIDPSILNKICIIFLEEEEDPGFEVHRWCLEYLKQVYHLVDIHYKADYIDGRVGGYNKILPFYLSAPSEKILKEIGSVKPFDDREIDVCYIVGASHKNRKTYFDKLQSLTTGNNIIEYNTHNYNMTQYFQTINNSKIFISVRGNGWGNTRNVEGPFCGAALFTEELEIAVPFEYDKDVSAVFFNAETLVPQLEDWLKKPNKLKTLAKKSREHCLKNHTSSARCKQMLSQARNLKGWP